MSRSISNNDDITKIGSFERTIENYFEEKDCFNYIKSINEGVTIKMDLELWNGYAEDPPKNSLIKIVEEMKDREDKVLIFEYDINNGELSYRWNNVIDGFDMPVEVKIDGETKLLQPTNKFQKLKIKNLYVNVDKDYYVYSKDLKVVVEN